MSYCSRRCNSLVLPFVTNQCLSCKRSEFAFHPTRHKWNPRENLPREFQRVQRLRGNRKPLFWLVKDLHLDLCIALNGGPRESSKPTVARAAHSCQLQITVSRMTPISATLISSASYSASQVEHTRAPLSKNRPVGQSYLFRSRRTTNHRRKDCIAGAAV